MRTKAWSLAAAILLTTAFTGCGGGGGGGGGGSGGFGADSYTVSPLTASFNATQGGATPAAQVSSITVNSGQVFVGTSQTGSGFTHNFQLTGATTGEITITPDSPTTAGTFTGTIVVRGCGDQFCSGGDAPGSPKTINVTYTVAAAPTLNVTPSTVNFSSNTGVAAPSQNVTLSLTSGPALAWTSSINYTSGTNGWLTLTPNGGVTPQVVQLSVNSPPVAAEVRTATVTFTAGALTRTLPITYTITDAGVNFISPYVGTTGVGGSVIIRGHGFLGLNPGAIQVQIGAAATVAGTRVSDTEIQATYPAIAAGSYTVTVTDGTITPPTRAGVKLLIMTPPVFPQATVVRGSTPGGVGNIVYDAERQSLFLLDGDNNRLYRYRFGAGVWTEDSTPSIGSGLNNRIALSPDGAVLLQTGGGALQEWDPATLTAGVNSSALGLLGAGAATNMIAFANDGNAIGNASSPSSGITLYRYDMLTRTFAALSTQSDMTNRQILAPANGDTLLLPTGEPLAAGFEKPVFTYDASDGSITQRALSTSGAERSSVSRDGSRFILVQFPLSGSQVTTVYTSAFVALGTLPAGLTAFAISPDGSTAWAYFPGTPPAVPNRVRRFNLNAPDGSDGFVEVGSPGTAVDSPGAFFSAMTVSPDGGTLFLAGRERVIILPAP